MLHPTAIAPAFSSCSGGDDPKKDSGAGGSGDEIEHRLSLPVNVLGPELERHREPRLPPRPDAPADAGAGFEPGHMAALGGELMDGREA